MTASAVSVLAPFLPRKTPADPGALAAMQRARLRGSMTWLTGGVFGAHLAGLQMPWATASGWVWFGLTALVALAMLTVGLAQLVLLVRAEQRRIPAVATVGALTALGILTAPLAGFLAIVGSMMHLSLPVAAAALGVALLSFDPRMRTGAPRPWLGAALGVVAGAVVLATGVLDTLVLLPLAMAPGLSLSEIYGWLGATGEDGGAWLPLAWAGLWLIAIVVLALGLLRNRRSQRGTMGLLLAAPVAALFALPLAQFPIGMSMGDAYMGAAVMTQAASSVAFLALLLAGALLAALASGLLIGARGR